MALSVKKKIWLGTSFLFFLLLLTGGVGIYFITKLKIESRNILHANYESLAYCHTMQQQLDNIETDYTKAINSFEEALKKQELNVTEPGEQEATSQLRLHFDKIKKGDTLRQNFIEVQNKLQEILRLNMNAIYNKNNIAQHTADTSFTVISLLAVIVFLISFSFLLNFPSIVTNPILKFSEAIKEISNKNYNYRIHIDNKDEFGKLANAFNEMTDRLQHFESSNLNKLMFEKSRAEAVINSLKDASIGIDKNNIILFANEQALQLLNMRNEDLIGKKAGDVTARNDLFKFLLENDSSVPFKIVVDNKENFFVKEVLEVKQAESNNKVIVLKNITSYKELDTAKTNFIATVSHELKTPLAASDFSLKLLEDERTGALSPQQKELIENLKQDNQRMLKILSELLNMSQVEAGKIQLNISIIQPQKIIETAIENVATNAFEKEITIKNLTAGSLPQLTVDADKTTWVLNNFLTNAIKYSISNSTIEIVAAQRDNNIIFSVTDHGVGIDPKYIPRLFERYFQVPGSKEKGTGLGLAISKEFIEAQNGKIWVESELGKGSIFYFQLPL